MVKVIRPYDPDWPAQFAAEATVVAAALGAGLCRIDHIGSTAVPGLIAKPVIDMLAEATDLDAIDGRIPAMQAAGYEARGEYGLPGRRYFKKASADRRPVGFHLHVYASGSPDLRRHRAFRDYLIARPDVAAAYAALKRSIADETGRLPEDYADRKSEFVRAIERASLLLRDRRD